MGIIATYCQMLPKINRWSKGSKMLTVRGPKWKVYWCFLHHSCNFSVYWKLFQKKVFKKRKYNKNCLLAYSSSLTLFYFSTWPWPLLVISCILFNFHNDHLKWALLLVIAMTIPSAWHALSLQVSACYSLTFSGLHSDVTDGSSNGDFFPH